MVDLARATSLISSFYDAALGGQGWPQALQHTAILAGSRAAVIHGQCAGSGTGLLCSAELDPDVAAQGAERYLALEGLAAYERSVPVGTVFALSEAVPAEALAASRFCAGWPPPDGCRQLLAALIERSQARCARLLLVSDQPGRAAPARASAALKVLLPHLQRALRVGCVLEQSESRAAAFSEALERAATAAIFLDGAGRLVHANRTGVQQLAEGRVVYSDAGRPRLRDAVADAQLRALLLDATDAARLPPAADHVLSLEKGARVTVDLLTLPNPRRSALGSNAAAVVAILMAEHAADLSERVHSVARHYAFTPAEARVVQALLCGCTIGSIARRLGIAEATVKTHLQHVFDKTDTRRQVDLVKRIADHAPPPRQRAVPHTDAPIAARPLSWAADRQRSGHHRH